MKLAPSNHDGPQAQHEAQSGAFLRAARVKENTKMFSVKFPVDFVSVISRRLNDDDCRQKILNLSVNQHNLFFETIHLKKGSNRVNIAFLTSRSL
jgi:hypothetical protein